MHHGIIFLSGWVPPQAWGLLGYTFIERHSRVSHTMIVPCSSPRKLRFLPHSLNGGLSEQFIGDALGFTTFKGFTPSVASWMFPRTSFRKTFTQVARYCDLLILLDKMNIRIQFVCAMTLLLKEHGMDTKICPRSNLYSRPSRSRRNTACGSVYPMHLPCAVGSRVCTPNRQR